MSEINNLKAIYNDWILNTTLKLKFTVSVFVRVARVIFQYLSINNITQIRIHFYGYVVANSHKQIHKISIFPDKDIVN